MDQRIVVVSGAGSNTGKTSLVCDLLGGLAGCGPWEAIKLTRGHHRSCGKDPEACCVSGLLGERPTIRSGREQTWAPGKDTGRYWEAGATNVHWVIATDGQVETGIGEALSRVSSASVIIEGTSLLRYFPAAFAVLTYRVDRPKIKPSARHALTGGLIDAVYTSDDQHLALRALTAAVPDFSLPVYSRSDLPILIDSILSALRA